MIPSHEIQTQLTIFVLDQDIDTLVKRKRHHCLMMRQYGFRQVPP